jgi:hypothetical protein
MPELVSALIAALGCAAMGFEETKCIKNSEINM